VFLGVPESEHVGIRVYFEQEIVIMRHVGNSGIHLFTLSAPFHPEITISRSLEGKYTFL